MIDEPSKEVAQFAPNRKKFPCHTPASTSYFCAKSRCYYEKDRCFATYGGRGIKMCARWIGSRLSFIADMGERPAGMTLDRKDSNGHYSCGKCEECMKNGWPANCRWANDKEQARNRRNNYMMTFHGETKCAKEWSELLGIKYNALKQRILNGWSDESALSMPVGKRGVYNRAIKFGLPRNNR